MKIGVDDSVGDSVIGGVGDSVVGGVGDSVGNETCPPINTTGYGAVSLILTLCVLSILGSILVTFTFVAFKELQSTSRKIFVILCLTDALSSLAHMSSVIIYMSVHTVMHKGLIIYIPTMFTIYFDISSMCWTCCLTVYLYMVIVWKRITISSRIFHSISWTIPGVGVISVVLVDHFLSGRVQSAVCLADVVGLTGARWDYLRGTGWEMATYILILPFFSLTCIHMFKARHSHETITSIQSASRKLLFVPVIFFLIRVSSTVRFMVKSYGPPMMPNRLEDGLLVLQAIGNNSQGFIDAILFCFCTNRIRRRLAVAMFCVQLCAPWSRKSRIRSRKLKSNFQRRLEENVDDSYEIVHLDTFEEEPMIK